MSEWPMRGHFRYLRFKTYLMTLRTPQCEVFWALLSSSKHSGVPEDSEPATFPSVGLHPHTWPKWGCDIFSLCQKISILRSSTGSPSYLLFFSRHFSVRLVVGRNSPREFRAKMRYSVFIFIFFPMTLPPCACLLLRIFFSSSKALHPTVVNRFSVLSLIFFPSLFCSSSGRPKLASRIPCYY